MHKYQRVYDSPPSTFYTPTFHPRLFTPDFLPLRLFTPTTFYPHIQFTSTAYSKRKVLHKKYNIYHNILNYQIVNKKLKVVISYSTQRSVCICWRVLRDEPYDPVVSHPFLADGWNVFPLCISEIVFSVSAC